MNLPTLAFRIVAACVARTAEGEVWTGKLEWLGETRRAIKDAVMAAASNGPETTATSEAADWLVDYLTLQSGSADSALIKAEGRTAGHCEAALHRPRKKLEITATSSGSHARRSGVCPPVVSRPVVSLPLGRVQ